MASHPKRAGNNPKRRLAPDSPRLLEELKQVAERVAYRGSGHHKRNPADYGLDRTSPRPTKSLCDTGSIISFDEAKTMLFQGIECGMVSDFRYDVFPKFVWFVAHGGDVYEAKTDGSAPGVYHGYPLEEEDDFRTYLKVAWKERCQKAGT